MVKGFENSACIWMILFNIVASNLTSDWVSHDFIREKLKYRFDEKSVDLLHFGKYFPITVNTVTVCKNTQFSMI